MLVNLASLIFLRNLFGSLYFVKMDNMIMRPDSKLLIGCSSFRHHIVCICLQSANSLFYLLITNAMIRLRQDRPRLSLTAAASRSSINSMQREVTV